MTSDSILKTITFPSYNIMSVVCLAVFSVAHVRLTQLQLLLPGSGLRLHTQQSLFECLLVLYRLVCHLARVVVLVAGGRMWVGVVLGEDAGAIVNGEDEDRLDAEER